MDGYRLIVLLSEYLLKVRTGVESGPQETTDDWKPYTNPDEVTQVPRESQLPISMSS